MFAKLTALAAAILLIPSALAGPVVPRRDTPNFYLVSVSSNPSYNLKSLKLNGNEASLTSGTDLQLFLESGFLRADATPSRAARVDFVIGGAMGRCTTDGDLIFLAGSTTNRCSTPTTFTLTSFELNSQLGARLTFPGGRFYACPSGKVRFSGSTPAGCEAIALWTAPVNVS